MSPLIGSTPSDSPLQSITTTTSVAVALSRLWVASTAYVVLWQPKAELPAPRILAKLFMAQQQDRKEQRVKKPR
jgi:hypothetical protein